MSLTYMYEIKVLYGPATFATEKKTSFLGSFCKFELTNWILFKVLFIHVFVSPWSEGVSACLPSQKTYLKSWLYMSLSLLSFSCHIYPLQEGSCWTLQVQRPKIRVVAAVAHILAMQLMEWCLKANLPWSQCLQLTSVVNPWWGVDLGAQRTVVRIKLYNHNNCWPEWLKQVNIYLGNNFNNYLANPEVASEITVPQHSPLGVEILMEGRYLFVGCPGHTALTLCEIQVWVI